MKNEKKFLEKLFKKGKVVLYKTSKIEFLTYENEYIFYIFYENRKKIKYKYFHINEKNMSDFLFNYISEDEYRSVTIGIGWGAAKNGCVIYGTRERLNIITINAIESFDTNWEVRSLISDLYNSDLLIPLNKTNTVIASIPSFNPENKKILKILKFIKKKHKEEWLSGNIEEIQSKLKECYIKKDLFKLLFAAELNYMKNFLEEMWIWDQLGKTEWELFQEVKITN